MSRLVLLAICSLAILVSVAARECDISFLQGPDGVNQTVDTFKIYLSVPAPYAQRIAQTTISTDGVAVGYVFMPNSSSFVATYTEDCADWYANVYTTEGVFENQFDQILISYGNERTYLQGTAVDHHGSMFWTYTMEDEYGSTVMIYSMNNSVLWEAGKDETELIYVTLVGGGDSVVYIATTYGSVGIESTQAIQLDKESSDVVTNVSISNFPQENAYVSILDHTNGSASMLTFDDLNDNSLMVWWTSSLFLDDAVFTELSEPYYVPDGFEIGGVHCDGRSWFAMLRSNSTDVYNIAHLPVNGTTATTYGPFTYSTAPFYTMDLWCH